MASAKFLFVIGVFFTTALGTSYATDLDKVCPKTVDPDFCNTVFGASSEVREQPMIGLLRIAVESAQVNATGAIKKLGELLKKASDYDHLAKLKRCFGFYSGLQQDLQLAALDLAEYKYNDLSFRGQLTTHNCKKCRSLFPNQDPIPTENWALGGLGSIMSICSYFLLGYFD